MTMIAPRERLRPATMLAKPVHIDPAFDDPAAVIALSRKAAPYRLSAAVHEKSDLGRDVPWFRTLWARFEELYEPDAAFIFYSERFIEAAKESFGARVIVPTALMNNVNAPMPGGIPHLDLPRFRGAEKFPFEMLVATNYSGLFHEWAVPIASTISWFYAGEGGDFDYWPDGPNGVRKTIAAPLWNVGVVSDNEYMFHRIGPIGPTEDQLAAGSIGRDAQLHADSDGRWTIFDGEERLSFREDQVRISILWKAYTFADERELAKYRSHEHDLAFGEAMKLLDRDLDRRGVGRLDLDRDYLDPHNRALIRDTYTAPALNDDPRSSAS